MKRLVLLILIPLIGVLHPFHYIIIFLLPLLAYFGMESSGSRGAQEIAVFLGVGVYAFEIYVFSQWFEWGKKSLDDVWNEAFEPELYEQNDETVNRAESKNFVFKARTKTYKGIPFNPLYLKLVLGVVLLAIALFIETHFKLDNESGIFLCLISVLLMHIAIESRRVTLKFVLSDKVCEVYELPSKLLNTRLKPDQLEYEVIRSETNVSMIKRSSKTLIALTGEGMPPGYVVDGDKLNGSHKLSEIASQLQLFRQGELYLNPED